VFRRGTGRAGASRRGGRRRMETATMHNGVLTVDLPKKAEALQKRRVVEIKQG
jgi:hypothetical protein